MRNLLWLSIISSSLLLLLCFFQWKLIDIFTPFLMPVVWLVAYGFFFLLFILSAIQLFKRKSWKPVTIQLMTILLLFLIPFNQIVMDIDFKLNKSERNEVVTKVQDGIFNSNATYHSSLIHLPDRYMQLSAGGGDIMVEKQGEGNFILFFTFRGILDGFSGFVYSQSDKKPKSGLFGGDFKQIKRIEKNWYFVTSS